MRVEGILGDNTQRGPLPYNGIALGIELLQRIEAEIRKEFPHVDRVLIHYEPRKQRSLRFAAALQDAQGTLGEHFGESPYFALVEIDLQEMKLSKQEIVANPHKDLAKGKGLKVARFLLTYKPDVIFCRESLSGKGPGYAFAEAGVETFQTQAKTLMELVSDLQEAKPGNANALNITSHISIIVL